jgi:prepilin-type N-terminal cleavage/methylation domain-containing protein
MKMFNRKAFRNKGFTVIEVIAVLIILGILAAIAVSRVMSNQNDLLTQADILKSQLRYAQLRALSGDPTGTTVTWGIDFSASSSYTLVTSAGSAGLLPAENSSTHTFPPASGVTVTGVPSTVNFDSWGSPVGGIAIVTLNQSGSTPVVITVSANTGFITP